MSCTALVNMSSSESFGIVLLEAWLANKPVIVNRQCAAFHDLAEDDHNAIMTDSSNLEMSIQKIISDKEYREFLSTNGKKTLSQYSWKLVCEQFVTRCVTLTK